MAGDRWPSEGEGLGESKAADCNEGMANCRGPSANGGVNASGGSEATGSGLAKCV